jgi:hypothetical protein
MRIFRIHGLQSRLRLESLAFQFRLAFADLLSQSTLLAVEWFSTNAYCLWHLSEHEKTDLIFNAASYRNTDLPQLQHLTSILPFLKF